MFGRSLQFNRFSALTLFRAACGRRRGISKLKNQTILTSELPIYYLKDFNTDYDNNKFIN